MLEPIDKSSEFFGVRITPKDGEPFVYECAGTVPTGELIRRATAQANITFVPDFIEVVTETIERYRECFPRFFFSAWGAIDGQIPNVGAKIEVEKEPKFKKRTITREISNRRGNTKDRNS